MRSSNKFSNRVNHSPINSLFIYYVPKKDQHHFRVGISVGKKLGNAVMRNQIKRYIRESLRQLESHIQPDVDIIIIARKPTTSMKVDEIKNSLKHVLKRTSLYRHKYFTFFMVNLLYIMVECIKNFRVSNVRRKTGV